MMNPNFLHKGLLGMLLNETPAGRVIKDRLDRRIKVPGHSLAWICISGEGARSSRAESRSVAMATPDGLTRV